jgi:hypothetical protein
MQRTETSKRLLQGYLTFPDLAFFIVNVFGDFMSLGIVRGNCELGCLKVILKVSGGLQQNHCDIC